MRLVLIFLLCLPLGAPAQIYRWTDEQGRTHFSQQPQPGAVSIEVKPQVLERDVATQQRELARERFHQARRDESEQKKQARIERLRERQQRCLALREQRESFDVVSKFYQLSPTGERQYYSDAQVSEARQRLDGQIRAECS